MNTFYSPVQSVRGPALKSPNHKIIIHEPDAVVMLIPDRCELESRQSDLVLAGLSQRQLEVLKLIAQGRPYVEIAHTMQVSLLTINTHIRRLFKKLDVNSRAQAAAVYVKISSRYGSEADSANPALIGKSSRQLEVLKLFARGYSFIEIASLLGVSMETIKTHVRRIYKKLNVNSRSQAVAAYLQISKQQNPAMCPTSSTSRLVF